MNLNSNYKDDISNRVEYDGNILFVGEWYVLEHITGERIACKLIKYTPFENYAFRGRFLTNKEKAFISLSALVTYGWKLVGIPDNNG